MKQISYLREAAAGIRLIVSDLDGTLLDAGARLTQRTLQAVSAVREQGIAFTVCTGREYAMLGLFLKQLELDVPVICNNGAEIVHPVSGEVLSRQLLPEKESRVFLRYCMRSGTDFCLTTPEAAYFPPGSGLTDFYEHYVAQTIEEGLPPFPVRYLQSPEEMEGLLHNKIILRTDLPGHDEACRFVEAHCPGMEFTTSSKLITDIVLRGVNKGRGVEAVAKMLGFHREECCAFGDFENDIPMFKFCKFSFAMENAERDVLQAASASAPPHWEDGVAQTLDKYFVR